MMSMIIGKIARVQVIIDGNLAFIFMVRNDNHKIDANSNSPIYCEGN